MLHIINGADGDLPNAGLIFTEAGNLYGTTTVGRDNNCGVAFELTPNVDGSWTESVIYELGFKACGPFDSLVFDVSGNLYGTTSQGGIGRNAGASLRASSEHEWELDRDSVA